MTGDETASDESTTDQPDAGDDLAAENRKLRKRVDELEAQLSAIQERLDEPTARSAGPDETTARSVDPTQRETVTNVTNPPSKIIGEFSNSSGVGVYGENTASSGENFGVQGVTNSSDFNAAGVYGKGTDKGSGVLAEAKNNYAVTAISTGSGAIFSQSDAGGFSAITGQNTSSSGTSIGVFGSSNSSETDAAGVKGKATASSGETVGVFGTTSSSDNFSAAVKGKARSNSGVTYGVKGQTNSPEGYGLYTPDDAQVGGDLSTVGSVSVGALGATAHLTSSQDVVDGEGIQTVKFDDRIYNDFQEGFDEATGEFTIQELGDYHITININTITDGAEFDLILRKNGSGFAWSYQNLNNGNLTKTERVLQAGDVITAAVKPISGDFTIDQGYGITYIDIDKIG